MKIFELRRLPETAHGTFGTLMDGEFLAVTLEQGWHDNRTDMSCIPFGEYLCRRIQSPSHGECFEVMGVPNRTHVLFHSGNLQADSKGCILIGSGFGTLNGQMSITESRAAVARFMAHLSGENEFKLILNGA